jgi:hypothetical protein
MDLGHGRNDVPRHGDQRAVGRLPLSNHSYGSITGWDEGDWSGTYGVHWFGAWGSREADTFGLYNSTARSWDQLCAAAPYFLPFKSAGNDRNDNAPANGTTFYYYNGSWQSKTYDSATDPYSDGWDNGGYDTISTYGVAKNIMTVGSVADAVSGGNRSLGHAAMSSFSAWGPADDGRIKPDVVANGEVALFQPGRQRFQLRLLFRHQHVHPERGGHGSVAGGLLFEAHHRQLHAGQHAQGVADSHRG